MKLTGNTILITGGENPDKVKAKLEAMVGPSGFMLFRTSDHGALLRRSAKRKRRFSISLATRCSPCR